ncbi:CDK5 regulatory subunit-associated protein 3 [Lepisosteus oculatus]|uniref:CDK5 regulatory subunit-associated protein 3 n=1 Tax=Lepisosteus oculatus TaxID=7918 RepID=UPI0037183B0C
MEDYQKLPIDIQTSKLLDWLVDRRHCSLKWQAAVQSIREKITTAVQDMPESEELRELLSGSYIHYFHCQRIVEILKDTEASSKNIFGRYSSQRMKDWQEILSLYEKDNAYLAELASLLVRSVTYEGPALRRQLAKAKQLQQELSRKELECQSGAADLRERYYCACRQYGITGHDVKRELQALVKDLPSGLGRLGQEAACLEEPIQLYGAFTRFVCDWSGPLLPMLTFAQKRGNATAYEWRTGVAPTVVERAPVEDAPPDTVSEETIDWGDLGGAGADLGITVEDGVDWGISLEPSADEADSGGIDWGEETASPVEIEVLEMGTDCPDGVARGEDALTLLENPQTRSQFINELMELELFLVQRLTEMSEEGDVLAMSQFQQAPPVIQAQTRDKVQAMLSQVRSMLEQLTNLRMQHLFTIQASPRYVERVTELLRQKLKQAEILAAKQRLQEEQREEALAEQARLEPKIDLLAQRTRELQRLIEADISKRYNDRPVNMMGVTV